jgi:Calx-beta domain
MHTEVGARQAPGWRRWLPSLAVTALVSALPCALAEAQATVSISDVTQAEGNGGSNQFAFTVSLSEPQASSVTVSYSTGDDPTGNFRATAGGNSCASGVDYFSLQSAVTLQGNSEVPPSAQVFIVTCGDTLDEFDETFVVNLTAVTGGLQIADGQGRGTLLDEDPEPSLRIADRSVTEGDAASVNAMFIVSLSAVSGKDVTVPAFATEDASARGVAACAPTAAATSDYVSTSGAASTIPRGSPSVTISVPVCGDTSDESNETFRVRLNGVPLNATLADGLATGTIVDNDPAPTISVADVSALEDKFVSRIVNGRPTLRLVNNSLRFNVALSAASGRNISFTANTANGTALGTATCAEGGDFEIKANQSLTIAAGATNLVVPVTTCLNLIQEPDETMTLTVSNAASATIIDGVATGTIVNNDTATGSFSVDPDDAVAAAGKPQMFAFSWAVPEPQNWRALRTMDLRIRDEDETILWLRWDQADNSFAEFDPATGSVGHAFLAGSNNRLVTRAVQVLLADTTVVPGGPDAPDVTLNLALAFKPNVAGRTFLIEAAASDDLGNQEEFVPVATVMVAPRK